MQASYVRRREASGTGYPLSALSKRDLTVRMLRQDGSRHRFTIGYRRSSQNDRFVSRAPGAD